MSYQRPKKLKSMMLNVTDACNLRCRYCFLSQKPNYMSYQVAKDATDLLVECYDGKEKQSLNFFGGEPLLMWDSIVEPLINYVRSNDLPLSLGITTNGILLDEKKAKFLKDNGVGLLFSIDGSKRFQDYNRPLPGNKSSYDVLEPKLPMILEYFNPTFRSTLLPYACGNIYENYMFAKEKGFRHYFTCPDDWSTYSEEDFDKMKADLHKIGLYYLDNYRKDTLPSDFIHFSPLEQQIGGLNKFYDKHSKEECDRHCYSQCGLGIYSCAVNWEGALFGCQECAGNGAVEENLHYIGDIYNGFDIERHKKLLAYYRGEEVICSKEGECDSCLYKYICNTGHCHANSYLITGKSNIKAYVRCVWDRCLLEIAISIDNILKEEPDSIYYKTFVRKK